MLFSHLNGCQRSGATVFCSSPGCTPGVISWMWSVMSQLVTQPTFTKGLLCAKCLVSLENYRMTWLSQCGNHWPMLFSDPVYVNKACELQPSMSKFLFPHSSPILSSHELVWQQRSRYTIFYAPGTLITFYAYILFCIENTSKSLMTFIIEKYLP